jgi:hypothetical protein
MSTTTERPIAAAYFEAVTRMAAVYGEPLPKEILELGDPERGWYVKLNATRKDAPDLPAYELLVLWGGFPAGLIGPYGGVIAAGSAANEETFCEWLKTAEITGATR